MTPCPECIRLRRRLTIALIAVAVLTAALVVLPVVDYFLIGGR